jgi:hypothetical protein
MLARRLLPAVGLLGLARTVVASAAPDCTQQSLYSLSAKSLEGVDTPLSFCDGKVSLVVNVASA